MTLLISETSLAGDRFASWLVRLEQTLTDSQGSSETSFLFAEDGYWMDFLAFTWRYRTFSGQEEIKTALGKTTGPTHPRNFKISPTRTAPAIVRRSGISVLEGFFDFETAHGWGTGYLRVRLGEQESDDRIWILSTTLQALKGAEPRVGVNRPRGYGDGGVKSLNKLEADESSSDQDADPEVLIVGGGQGGLILGARLKQMGVDTLILEKQDRVGDNWRQRYESLVLHNEIPTNTLPYMPFPATWPSFLPKDKVAHWLETYVDAMGLNVQTGMEVLDASRDEDSSRWNVRVRHSDGSESVKNPRHVVLATGGHSGVPNIPDMQGLSDFNGEVIHTSRYAGSSQYVGKKAIIFGTGSSAHDIAQDLYERGATSVTMIQRSPSAIISLDPCGTMIYAAYTDEATSEDVDLVQAATPYPIESPRVWWRV